MTPNGEHKNGPVRSWRRVQILTPRHLCETPHFCVATPLCTRSIRNFALHVFQETSPRTISHTPSTNACELAVVMCAFSGRANKRGRGKAPAWKQLCACHANWHFLSCGWEEQTVHPLVLSRHRFANIGWGYGPAAHFAMQMCN